MKAKKKTKTQIKNEFVDALASTVYTYGMLATMKTRKKKPYIDPWIFHLLVTAGRHERITEIMNEFLNTAEKFIGENEEK